MWMPVFPAIFKRVAGILLSVDGSATGLPAILLDVGAPLTHIIQVKNVKRSIFKHNIENLGLWVVTITKHNKN